MAIEDTVTDPVVETTATTATATLDYATAIETLKGVEFEGKDAILAGIQSGITERNSEAKSSREEMKTMKNTLDTFIEQMNTATGKQIDPTSEIDVKSFGAEISNLKSEVTTIKEERDKAQRERSDAILTTAITKELAGKVSDEGKEDAFELLAGKFEQNSAGEIVSSASGKKLSEEVQVFLDKRPHFKAQNAKTGAGLRKSNTDTVDSSSVHGKAMDVLRNIRAGG